MVDHHGMLQMMLVVPSQLCLKSGPSTNQMGRLLKGSVLVDQGRHLNIKIENLKQYALKTENAQQTNKEQMVRNWSQCL